MVREQKELKDRCEEFFSGKKNIQENEKEYSSLQSALLEAITEMEDRPDICGELWLYYDELIKLK